MREAKLRVLLDTARVRENWLQFELLYAARVERNLAFYINYTGADLKPHYIGKGGPDLACWESETSDAPVMIGELKFLGNDYAEKVFAGEKHFQGYLDELTRSGALRIDCNWQELHDPELAGLVCDYQRLLTYTGNRNVERLLVLIHDLRCQDRRLEKLLSLTQFEGPGVVAFETKDTLIRCKVWRVSGWLD